MRPFLRLQRALLTHHLHRGYSENKAVSGKTLDVFGFLSIRNRPYSRINSRYIAGKNNFVLIDEIQMCEDFEKAVNGWHASEKYDIYITGSNAFLLSSDLATLFTGRTFEIKVYPFSFAEYVQYYAPSDFYTAFENYLQWSAAEITNCWILPHSGVSIEPRQSKQTALLSHFQGGQQICEIVETFLPRSFI